MRLEEAKAVAAIISRLPEPGRSQALGDLTWWCLANLDDDGAFLDAYGIRQPCVERPRPPVRGRPRKAKP